MKTLEITEPNKWRELDFALADNNQIDLLLGSGALGWIHRP